MNEYSLIKKIPTIDWLKNKYNIIIKYELLPQNIKGMILKKHDIKYVVINLQYKNDLIEYMNLVYESLDLKDNMIFEVISEDYNIIKSNTIRH